MRFNISYQAVSAVQLRMLLDWKMFHPEQTNAGGGRDSGMEGRGRKPKHTVHRSLRASRT